MTTPRDVTDFVRTMTPRPGASPGPGTFAGLLGPVGREAYARVLHPARRADGAPVLWADVDPSLDLRTATELRGAPATDDGGVPPSLGEPPGDLLATLQSVLARHTGTPELFVAVWEGGGDVDASVALARLELPSRSCLVYVLPATDLPGRPWAPPTADDPAPPTLWCPTDLAWTVGHDVDVAYTAVGGSSALVHDLVGHPGVEAVEVTLDAPR